jgi:hypothetical protein
MFTSFLQHVQGSNSVDACCLDTLQFANTSERRSEFPRMVYDSSLYVEKSAWDPSVYVNTTVVFGGKSYISPGQPVPIASGSPVFGFTCV